MSSPALPIDHVECNALCSGDVHACLSYGDSPTDGPGLLDCVNRRLWPNWEAFEIRRAAELPDLSREQARARVSAAPYPDQLPFPVLVMAETIRYPWLVFIRPRVQP